MSLIDNRLGKLIPVNNEVEIGLDQRPINTVYVKNLETLGTLKAQHFEGDAVKNLDITKIIKEQESKGNAIGGSNNPFTNVYVENLTKSKIVDANEIIGGAISGTGNDIVLDNLKHDIIPFGVDRKLGTSSQQFSETHTDSLFARQVVADQFEGDGSKLYNLEVQPDLSGIVQSIVPLSNEAITIGEDEKRINTVFTRNVSATDRLMGKKLIISNSPLPVDISSPQKIDLSWFDEAAVSSEIMLKFGSHIHFTVENMLCGVSLFNEVIAMDMMIRNVIYPEQNDHQRIGTSNRMFSDIYVKDAHIPGVLTNEDTAHLHDVTITGDTTCSNVQAKDIMCDDIFAGNIRGNGQFITNLSQLGPLVQDLDPADTNVVSLGSAEKTYKNVHAHTVICENLVKPRAPGSTRPQVLYAVPKESHFNEFGILPFESGTMLSVFEYDAKTHRFTSPGFGFCTVGFNLWDTSYKIDDPNVKWIIEHKKYAGGKYSYYNIEGPNTHTMVVNKGDQFHIAVNPEYRVKGLGIKPRSVMAMHFTMIDDYMI